MFEPCRRFSIRSWKPSISTRLTEGDHADDGRGPALAQHVERLFGRRLQPDRLEGVIDATTGELEHREHRVGIGRVDEIGGAPNSAASCSFDATRSTAMMRPAPRSPRPESR